MDTSTLTITGFNMRSLNSNVLYVNELMSKYESDIVFIAEHRLYPNELHKLNCVNDNYDVHAKLVKT